MISKERLVFDIADLTSSDAVGAYMLDSSGNGLSSTAGALHISDGGGSITVDASNLDIRDLAFATDKVDASGSSVSITGTVAVTQSTSPWVIGDGGGSITVDAVDLDIRNLNFSTDSVTSRLNDGAGNSISSTSNALNVFVTGSGALTINDAALANTAFENTAKSVTTTTGVLLATQLAARKYMYVQNLGSKSIYVGKSGVTTSDGLRLSAGAIGEFRFGPALSLHAVADSGTQDIRLMEVS